MEPFHDNTEKGELEKRLDSFPHTIMHMVTAPFYFKTFEYYELAMGRLNDLDLPTRPAKLTYAGALLAITIANYAVVSNLAGFHPELPVVIQTVHDFFQNVWGAMAGGYVLGTLAQSNLEKMSYESEFRSINSPADSHANYDE